MTSDALAVVQTLFSVIWQLFTSWHIPGTNVTPASAFLFFVAAGIGLKFFLRVLGTSDTGSIFRGTRAGSRSDGDKS